MKAGSKTLGTQGKWPGKSGFLALREAVLRAELGGVCTDRNQGEESLAVWL